MAGWDDWKSGEWEEIKPSQQPPVRQIPVQESTSQDKTGDWNNWDNEWDESTPAPRPVASYSKEKPVRISRTVVPKKKPSGRTLLSPTVIPPILAVHSDEQNKSLSPAPVPEQIFNLVSSTKKVTVDLEDNKNCPVTDEKTLDHSVVTESPKSVIKQCDIPREENRSPVADSLDKENVEVAQEIFVEKKPPAQDDLSSYIPTASSVISNLVTEELQTVEATRELEEVQRKAQKKTNALLKKQAARQAKKNEEELQLQLEQQAQERSRLQELEALEEQRRLAEERVENEKKKEADRIRLEQETNERLAQESKRVECERLLELERLKTAEQVEAENARIWKAKLAEEEERENKLRAEEERIREEQLRVEEERNLEKERLNFEERRRAEAAAFEVQHKKTEEIYLIEEERRKTILHALAMDLQEEKLAYDEAKELEEQQHRAEDLWLKEDLRTDNFNLNLELNANEDTALPPSTNVSDAIWPVSGQHRSSTMSDKINDQPYTNSEWMWNDDNWVGNNNSTLENELCGQNVVNKVVTSALEDSLVEYISELIQDESTENQNGIINSAAALVRSSWENNLSPPSDEVSKGHEIYLELRNQEVLESAFEDYSSVRKSSEWDEFSIGLNPEESEGQDPRSSTFAENAEISHFVGFGTKLNGSSPISLSPLNSRSSVGDEDPDDVIIQSLADEPIYFEVGETADRQVASFSDRIDSITRNSRSECSSSKPDDSLHRFDPDLRDTVFDIPFESRSSESDYRQRDETDRSSHRSDSRSGSYTSYSSEQVEDADSRSHCSGETVDSSGTNWTITEPMEKIMRAFGPILGLPSGTGFAMPLPSLGPYSFSYPYQDFYQPSSNSSLMPEFFPTVMTGEENLVSGMDFSTPFVMKHLYPYSTGALGTHEVIRVDNFAPPIALENYEVKTNLSSELITISKFPHDLLEVKPDTDEKLSNFCKFMAECITDIGSLDNVKREEALLWNLLSLLARHGSGVRNFAVSEVLMAASRDPCIAMSSTSLFNGHSQSENYPGEKKLASVRRSLAAGLIPRACRVAEENGRTSLSFMLLSLPSVTKTNNKGALEGFLRYLDKTVSPSDPIYTACSLMCGGSPKLVECLKNWTIHVAVTVGCGVLIPSSAKTKFLLTLADMMDSCGKYAARDVLYLLSRPTTRLLNGRNNILVGTNFNVGDSGNEFEFLERDLDKVHLSEAFVYVTNKLTPNAKCRFVPAVQFSYLNLLLGKEAEREAVAYLDYFVGEFLAFFDESPSIENSLLLLTLFELFTAHQKLVDNKSHAGINWKEALSNRVAKYLAEQRQLQLAAHLKESQRMLELKFKAEAAQIEMENRRREVEWQRIDVEEREASNLSAHEEQEKKLRQQEFQNIQPVIVFRSSAICEEENRTSPVFNEVADANAFPVPLFNVTTGGPADMISVSTASTLSVVTTTPTEESNIDQRSGSPLPVPKRDENHIDDDWENEHMHFFKLKKQTHDDDGESLEEGKKENQVSAYSEEIVSSQDAYSSRRSSNLSELAARERLASNGSVGNYSVEDHFATHKSAVTFPTDDQEDVPRISMHYSDAPRLWDYDSRAEIPLSFHNITTETQNPWTQPTEGQNSDIQSTEPAIDFVSASDNVSVVSDQYFHEIGNASQTVIAKNEQYVEAGGDSGSVQQYYWLTSPVDGAGYDQSQTLEYGNFNTEAYANHTQYQPEQVQANMESMTLQEQWNAYYASMAVHQSENQNGQNEQSWGPADGFAAHGANYSNQPTEQPAYTTQMQQPWSETSQLDQNAYYNYYNGNNYGGYDQAGNYYAPTQPAASQQNYGFAEPEVPDEEDDEAGTPGIPATPQPFQSMVAQGVPTLVPDIKPTSKPGLMGRFTGLFKKSSPELIASAATSTSEAQSTSVTSSNASQNTGFAPRLWQPSLPISNAPNQPWSNVALDGTEAPPIFTSPLMYSSVGATVTPSNTNPVPGYPGYGYSNGNQALTAVNQFQGNINYHAQNNSTAPAQISQLNAYVIPGQRIPPLY